MANMNFGVNILPKANNTYTLGNSDYKWNIFANSLNGVSLSNIITDVQVNGISILSNNIANIPLASTSAPGVVMINGYGLWVNPANGHVSTTKASTNQIKEGTQEYYPIVPYNLKDAVFYGLAKAAGDSTQASSSNAVGTYTSGAQSAIQNMLAVAPTANPIFTGSISLGRDANSNIGYNSISLGHGNAATGSCSIAMGLYNYANADASVAIGYNNITMGTMSFAGGYGNSTHGAFSYAFGLNTTNDIPSYTEWTASTSYVVGDNVVNSEDNLMYTCIEANSDATFNRSKWVPIVKSTFIERIGNGELNISTGEFGAPSNARALDWQGNEYLNGDLYINCNNDSSSGTSITEALNKKISITSDTVTGNPCTFNSDVEDIPLKSIKLGYEFSQPGNGDPYPTNIRPITGISDFFIVNTKKNMARVRGFSATNKQYDQESELSNNYGTTINTIEATDTITITQASSSTEYTKSNFRNGYFSIRLFNECCIDYNYYDISFKVTDITSNPLDATFMDVTINSPGAGQQTPTEVKDNIIIFKNVIYIEATNARCAWEIRNCGMSCTISEFMVTPANTNDGVYEPYDGTKLDVTFPALGKNLFNVEFSRTNVDYQTGGIGSSTTRITSDFVELAPNTYTFSLKEGKQLTVYFYTQPIAGSNYFVLSERISDWKSTPLTFTTTEKRYALFVLRNSDNSEILTTDVSEVMLNTGSSASTYEPYTNSVGIGLLDATSGTLTVTHMIYTTTWGKGEAASIKGNNERRRFTAPFVFKDASVAKTGTSNIAPWDWDYDRDTVHFYNHQQYSYVFLPIDTSDDTEIQIMGQLAEPRVISVPPITIKTFKGTNTIWANTNGLIEIENHIDLQTIKEYADNAGIQDVQINGTSILNNKIANIPIATANDYSGYRLVKVNYSNGINIASDNCLSIVRAIESDAKAGNNGYRICTPYWQHCYTFYGLAKAAGDSTQSASSNAVGVYTDSAKTAIQNMLAVAPTANPVFTGSISLGRAVNTTIGENSFAFGENVEASGEYSHAEGCYTTASGDSSHAEGENTTASGHAAHAEGYETVASGYCSHAEGESTTASEDYAHAEGSGTTASESYAHAEGSGTTASAYSAHAEGGETIASGEEAHAEGNVTTASGYASHAEGGYTTASGYASHAEGEYTIASEYTSHAEGFGTEAVGGFSHVVGRYNVPDNYNSYTEWVSNKHYSIGDIVKRTSINEDKTITVEIFICSVNNSDSTFNFSHWTSLGPQAEFIEIVGNGISDDTRSNARALDWDGNEHLKGSLYVGCNADSTGGTQVATVSDISGFYTKPSGGIPNSDLATPPAVMTGATSSAAGTAGYAPAPATTDVDKFLAGDGTYKSGGLPMVILSYGNSTWAEFEAAYNNNVIVYCRASSNSNPATGSQTRMAFMAYVNNATTPTEVEFQYYRSMSAHSATTMGDQVFVYKLTKTSGWSVTSRDASIKQIKMATDSAGSVSWSSNVVTLDSGLPAVTASDNGKILKVINGAWAVVDP